MPNTTFKSMLTLTSWNSRGPVGMVGTGVILNDAIFLQKKNNKNSKFKIKMLKILRDITYRIRIVEQHENVRLA